jgi:hypothetical protein
MPVAYNKFCNVGACEIPVIRNLPVGKHLQDHVMTGLDLVLLNQSLPLSLSAAASPVSAFKYFLFGQGTVRNTLHYIKALHHSLFKLSLLYFTVVTVSVDKICELRYAFTSVFYSPLV